MKATAFIILMMTLAAFKPAEETTLIGHWQNENGTRSIEFYQTQAGIDGKITEDENSLLEGKVVFKNLKFDGKAYHGTCFLPKRNRTIRCTLLLTSPNTVAITGKMGMMSDTKVWKRK